MYFFNYKRFQNLITYAFIQGVCEDEDVNIGEEEAAPLNDDEFEDREDKFETEFDGNGSPMHTDSCYETQMIIRNPSTAKCSDDMLLHETENGTAVSVMESCNRISMASKNQCELEAMEIKNREKQIEGHVEAKESSQEEDFEEEDPPSSPVLGPDSEVCK